MAGSKKTIAQIMDEYDSINGTSSATHEGIQKALGVSFGGQTIYFAEAEKAEGDYRITRYGSMGTNLKFGTGIEGMEKNIRDVYMFINGMVDNHNIEAQHLNLSMNTHLTVIHPAVIQGVFTSAEIEHHLRWEFSRQLLDDLNQYNVSTVTIEEDPDTGDRHVLLAGMRKKIAENFSTVLEKAKVRLSNIDIDIFCSHAAYEMNYSPDSDYLTVIADLKPGVAGILVCLGHDVKTFYQFVFPSKAAGEHIADILNHHLDNLAYLFNSERQTRYEIGRTLLCNILSASAAPHMESKFGPECMNPFQRLPKPERFAESGKDHDDPEKKEEPEFPEENTTMYAESVGAAIKLLA